MEVDDVGKILREELFDQTFKVWYPYPEISIGGK